MAYSPRQLMRKIHDLRDRDGASIAPALEKASKGLLICSKTESVVREFTSLYDHPVVVKFAAIKTVMFEVVTRIEDIPLSLSESRDQLKKCRILLQDSDTRYLMWQVVFLETLTAMSCVKSLGAELFNSKIQAYKEQSQSQRIFVKAVGDKISVINKANHELLEHCTTTVNKVGKVISLYENLEARMSELFIQVQMSSKRLEQLRDRVNGNPEIYGENFDKVLQTLTRKMQSLKSYLELVELDWKFVVRGNTEQESLEVLNDRLKTQTEIFDKREVRIMETVTLLIEQEDIARQEEKAYQVVMSAKVRKAEILSAINIERQPLKKAEVTLSDLSLDDLQTKKNYVEAKIESYLDRKVLLELDLKAIEEVIAQPSLFDSTRAWLEREQQNIIACHQIIFLKLKEMVREFETIQEIETIKIRHKKTVVLDIMSFLQAYENIQEEVQFFGESELNQLSMVKSIAEMQALSERNSSLHIRVKVLNRSLEQYLSEQKAEYVDLPTLESISKIKDKLFLTLQRQKDRISTLLRRKEEHLLWLAEVAEQKQLRDAERLLLVDTDGEDIPCPSHEILSPSQKAQYSRELSSLTRSQLNDIKDILDYPYQLGTDIPGILSVCTQIGWVCTDRGTERLKIQIPETSILVSFDRPHSRSKDSTLKHIRRDIANLFEIAGITSEVIELKLIEKTRNIRKRSRVTL